VDINQWALEQDADSSSVTTTGHFVLGFLLGTEDSQYTVRNHVDCGAITDRYDYHPFTPPFQNAVCKICRVPWFGGGS
jgi:hypothetical protein